jgi:LCP family protein required for cell wall assembly
MNDDRDAPQRGEQEPPRYTLYRARPRLFGRRADSPELERLRELRPAGERRRGLPPIDRRRVLRWLAIALAAWVALSLVLFMISAQFAAGVSDRTKSALSPGSWPLSAANTILVLGSDQRTKRTHEPGGSTSGPSRSDVMMLIRVGGGSSARLSIPRDTIAQIPGHGVAKINAAYAFGGAALAIQTVDRYLGIKINHVVEINFDNFPKLVDSLGGIDYTGGCVRSRINGGFRNGGFTLRLRRGTSHLNGRQALALARTRHNDCNRGESDLIRARRQQKLFTAIKHRLTSPAAFVRLPWVSWAAPQTIKTDMGAFTLLGLFGALETSGSPSTRVLKPSGVARLSDGGIGLTVSANERRAETQRFLRG